jgi:hypothetical protein
MLYPCLGLISGTVRSGLSGLLCAAGLFVSSAANAQDDFEAQKKRLVAAIEAAGCVVNESNQGQILAQSGLTPDQGSVVVNQLMDEGAAEPAGENLRLTAGGCR